MKWLLCLLMLFVTSYVAGQDSLKGIQFQKGLRWQQVISKAKAEKKNIFVDCYTTWCVPCKKMEQNVYSLKEVGDFFNEKFVSVKFQMDSTPKDDEWVRQQYGEAYKIKNSYTVDAFPTFLFFTPDGKLLYKNIGGSDANAFIKIASETIKPEKNYYTFLEEYNRGKRDYQKIALMARAALNLKDTINANKLAKDYVVHLKKTDWFTKSNIEFCKEFTRNTKDLGFVLCYKYPERVNKVMDNKDYAQSFVQSIIYNESVSGVLKESSKKHQEPKWNAIKSEVSKKYGIYYGERVITSAKLRWYRYQQNGPQTASALVKFFDKYVLPNIGIFKEGNSIEDLVLNNAAWEVFQNSNKKEELLRALEWSNMAIRMEPSANWMDTYANILYKLGKKQLAIQWESAALQILPKDADIQHSLELMKKGLATWPEQK